MPISESARTVILRVAPVLGPTQRGIMEHRDTAAAFPTNPLREIFAGMVSPVLELRKLYASSLARRTTSASLRVRFVPVHIPLQIPRRCLVHGRCHGREIRGHVVLESPLADEPEKFL